MGPRPSSSIATKQNYFCFLGGPAPQTPPSSRTLSQALHASFEHFSQVGRCRSLQGREVSERYQARGWPGGPGLAHTFCFPTKRKTALFIFGRRVGYIPPLPNKEKFVLFLQ